jgi:hypothetical protein
MKLFTHLALLLSSLALAGAAQAVVLSSTSGNAITDFSGTSQVAFDLDLADFSPTTLNFVIEEADLLSPTLSFNAIVRNLSGTPLSHFRFSLQGIVFGAPGSVAPTFGSVKTVQTSDTAASIQFGTPELAEFHFGNPFATGGFSDWLLDTTGLRAGDRFSISANVPEPGTLTLMLAGLFLFSFAKRTRDKR